MRSSADSAACAVSRHTGLADNPGSAIAVLLTRHDRQPRHFESCQEAVGVARDYCAPSDREQTGARFVWMDVHRPTSLDDFLHLADWLNLHPLTIEDCLQIESVQKVEHFPENAYLFAVVHVQQAGHGDLDDLVPLCFIVTPFAVVTVHHQPVYSMDDVLARVAKHFPAPSFVLYCFFDTFVDHIGPDIDCLVDESEVLQELVAVLSLDEESDLLLRLSLARRRLISVRRILAFKQTLALNLTGSRGHVAAARRIPGTARPLLVPSHSQPSFVTPGEGLVIPKDRAGDGAAADRSGCAPGQPTKTDDHCRQPISKGQAPAWAEGGMLFPLHEALRSDSSADLEGVGDVEFDESSDSSEEASHMASNPLAVAAGLSTSSSETTATMGGGILSSETRLYLRDVMDHTDLYMHKIEMARETLGQAQQNYLNRMQTQIASSAVETDQAVKKLTLMSLAMLPVGAVAVVMGMNTRVPFDTYNYHDTLLPFFGIVGGSVVLSLALVVGYTLYTRNPSLSGRHS